jgi:hypothetical protein
MTEPDDDDLLAREAALQDEAAAVLVDLDLLALIGPIGIPTQTGSSALGLMVARDIDVTTICPSLELDLVFELGRALARQPRVRRLSFRNDTGAWNVDPAYPDGLYWMVDYRTAAGADWNLDLWFLAEGTTQFDLEHLKTMPQQLRPHTRLAILRIKEACQGRTPRVRSQRIYEAVLDHGIRTPDAFEGYLAEHP